MGRWLPDELAVLDYGGGNIGSLVAALERRGVAFDLTDDANVVAAADAAILPGDGAFGATMDALRERGLDRAVHAVVAAGMTVSAGICVGMQVLFETSDEFGDDTGLGIFRGHCGSSDRAPRVPHAWAGTFSDRARPSVRRRTARRRVRRNLHSYAVSDSDATVASTDYGGQFAAVVARDNVMATQYHPDKSHRPGALLLDIFLMLAR